MISCNTKATWKIKHLGGKQRMRGMKRNWWKAEEQSNHSVKQGKGAWWMFPHYFWVVKETVFICLMKKAVHSLNFGLAVIRWMGLGFSLVCECNDCFLWDGVPNFCQLQPGATNSTNLHYLSMLLTLLVPQLVTCNSAYSGHSVVRDYS